MSKQAPSSHSAHRKPRRVAPGLIQPNAGGIDIGAEWLYAAVPPERAAEPVRCFGTFTENLHALAAWLQACGVTTVAMESTGVFWIPVFQVLEAAGIEVYLVNARQVKNVPGRKSDVADCQWLQYLHAVGLLRASFRPPDQVCQVRSLLRHRQDLVAEGARHIQLMQKSLTQMNLHLHHVLSDLSGVSGLAIIDAILAGEHNPKVLAKLRDRRVKASEETVRKALVGDYRREHLFTLRQAREAYRFCRQQLATCDAEIERYLAEVASAVDPEETPPPASPSASGKTRKGEIALPSRDLRTEMYRIYGTDLTRVTGLGASSVCALYGELGRDLKAAFPTVEQFTSWTTLCPNPQISGGKVLKKGTRHAKNRVAAIFRLAAQTLHHSDSALGAYFRRMRAKLGTPAAITAAAHKLARIFYHLVTTRKAYDESVFAEQEAQHERRRKERLKAEVAKYGFTLVPQPAAA